MGRWEPIPSTSVTRTSATERTSLSLDFTTALSSQSATNSHAGGSGVSSNLCGFPGRRISPQESVRLEWEGRCVFPAPQAQTPDLRLEAEAKRRVRGVPFKGGLASAEKERLIGGLEQPARPFSTTTMIVGGSTRTSREHWIESPPRTFRTTRLGLTAMRQFARCWSMRASGECGRSAGCRVGTATSFPKQTL